TRSPPPRRGQKGRSRSARTAAPARGALRAPPSRTTIPGRSPPLFTMKAPDRSLASVPSPRPGLRRRPAGHRRVARGQRRRGCRRGGLGSDRVLGDGDFVRPGQGRAPGERDQEARAGGEEGERAGKHGATLAQLFAAQESLLPRSVMDPSLRSAFNAAYTPDFYPAYLARLERRVGCK